MAPTTGGPPILRRIDTSPVGFAVMDRVLLTVHPTDCAVRDAYAAKLLQAASQESRAAGARLPTSPADLMLRVINQMVDGFLELRRELTHQLDHWQTELLQPAHPLQQLGRAAGCAADAALPGRSVRRPARSDAGLD